jgi:hypothetical protein
VYLPGALLSPTVGAKKRSDDGEECCDERQPLRPDFHTKNSSSVNIATKVPKPEYAGIIAVFR